MDICIIFEKGVMGYEQIIEYDPNISKDAVPTLYSA